MITIHDKHGKKYRVKFEKRKKEINIYLFVGREKHFVSVIDLYKDTKTAEIQEFILEFGFVDCKRRGLGTKISALLEEQLKERGILFVKGDVVEKDRGAEKFWKKQGYNITSLIEGPVRFTIKKKLGNCLEF